jgi:hypothetical protein
LWKIKRTERSLSYSKGFVERGTKWKQPRYNTSAIVFREEASGLEKNDAGQALREKNKKRK